MSVSRPVRQAPLGEQIAHELRVMIVTGRLKPGDRLVEDSLSVQFDVSRGPVRDALRLLINEGLVEPQRRGVAVAGLTSADVDELYSLREALELLALRETMRRADADWSLLEQSLSELRAAADDGSAADYAAADLEFHSKLYELSGHRRLQSTWAQHRPTFHVLLEASNAQDADLHPSAEAHADLLKVMRSGNVDAAAALLSEHLFGARNRIRTAREESNPQG
ncbi:GntR family transcriptional regulator [Kribbella sp. GL6]|uniref:GntR family transcriptional regulator n=1 Tax=Kribbella sp. GL6 TaxID=3419765 RepID=UPI003D02F4F0